MNNKQFSVSIFNRETRKQTDINKWYKTLAGAMRKLSSIDNDPRWDNIPGMSVHIWQHSRDENGRWVIERVKSVTIS